MESGVCEQMAKMQFAGLFVFMSNFKNFQLSSSYATVNGLRCFKHENDAVFSEEVVRAVSFE